MTNKERSKAIRETLKKAGYNTRDFSIRSRDCGYSDATDISVKNLSIKLEEIEKLVNHFEKIDYDQYSGEILMGCNTYINVSYDYSIKSAAAKAAEPEIKKLLDNLEAKAAKKGYADIVMGNIRVYVKNNNWNMTEILHECCERTLVADSNKDYIYSMLPGTYVIAKAQNLIRE